MHVDPSGPERCEEREALQVVHVKVGEQHVDGRSGDAPMSTPSSPMPEPASRAIGEPSRSVTPIHEVLPP